MTMGSEAPDVRWEGGCRSRWALPTGAVFAAVGVSTAAAGVAARTAGAVVGGATLAVAAAVPLAFVAIHVQVTDEAVRVLYGGRLRRPATTVRLADVETVDVVTVHPLRHGGWGYRGSLRLFRRAAVVLRKGPGVRLALRGGRVFVVTVDDAEGMADAIRLSRGPGTGG